MPQLRRIIVLTLLTIFAIRHLAAQQPDSLQQVQPPRDTTPRVTYFSGNIGLTNNGFSIIPTFSLNSPAVIMNYYFRHKRFSFDPDIRLVPDASKGGMLFWFRYYAVEKKKFTLRLGAHPAFTLIRRTVKDQNKDVAITEMLRFLAGEIAPSYRIRPRWQVGAIYLHGSALQQQGPQQTDVLFLTTTVSDLKLGKNLRFTAVPMVFFLLTDGYRGDYFSATGIFSHRKYPFALQSTINQTFRSNVPDNQNFMWNVTLSYGFSRKWVRG